MNDILTSVRSARRTATPQTVKTRPDEVFNAAGGAVFSTGDAAQLHRFLTIGSAGGTFYTGERELTRANAEVLVRELARDGIETVKHIVEVSKAGRAPKQDYGLFALAMATSAEFADEATRKLALASVPEVARTGSTLMKFLQYAEQFRGWGRGLRTSVAGWYNDRSIEQVAYQVFKYRNRDDRRHDDVLRQAHPYGSVDHNLLYNYLAASSPTAGSRRKANGGAAGWNRQLNGNVQRGTLPVLVDAFETVQAMGKAATWTKAYTRETVLLIQGHNGLSWEMLPDAALGQREVWEALFEDGIPQTALMRQLPRLTRLGMCNGDFGRKVAAQLVDVERLKKARVHPVSVLVAQRTYAKGVGAGSTWIPETVIVNGLDEMFYASYGAVEPAGKNTMIALDLSASMTWQPVSTLPHQVGKNKGKSSTMPLDAREMSAALSMVTAATEPEYEIVGFTSGHASYGHTRWTYAGRMASNKWGNIGSAISKLDISPRRRLDDIVAYIASQPAGGTDCALPMLYAAANRIVVDTFQVYTDNETWAGAMKVGEALERYRQTMGRDARLAVVSMTATGTSICDPQDDRQMDVSGFDSAIPTMLADFSAGRL